MFELTEFTEARLASVTNRIEKHGDEDVPAITLSVVITAANTLLDTIDPGLRHALYKAKPDEVPELPGMEAHTPILRTNCIDTVVLTTSHEGWKLLVDDDIDESDPMAFEGVKVDKLRVDAKQGGSIELTARLGTSDVDADRLGKLGMHNGQSIWVKLLKPEVKADAIDGSVDAFKKDHPDATDLFAATGETGSGTDETGSETVESSTGDPEGTGETDDDGSAHPDVGPQGLASLEAALQADQREQAELEAGMAASLDAAGVAPKGRRGRKALAGVE
jgi:hypothetical protein